MIDNVTSEQIAALYEVVRAAHRQNPSASPAWLATAAMQTICFPRDLHPAAYAGTHQTFAQIAHAVAAGKDRDQIIRALEAGIDPATDEDNLPLGIT